MGRCHLNLVYSFGNICHTAGKMNPIFSFLSTTRRKINWKVLYLVCLMKSVIYFHFVAQEHCKWSCYMLAKFFFGEMMKKKLVKRSLILDCFWISGWPACCHFCFCHFLWQFFWFFDSRKMSRPTKKECQFWTTDSTELNGKS